MFLYRDFVVGSIVVYAVLYFTFFHFYSRFNYSEKCYYNGICVRFCCRDADTCKEEFIKENLNGSSFLHQGELKVSILYGPPKDCSLKSQAEKEWVIDEASLLSIMSNDNLFASNRLGLPGLRMFTFITATTVCKTSSWTQELTGNYLFVILEETLRRRYISYVRSMLDC